MRRMIIKKSRFPCTVHHSHSTAIVHVHNQIFLDAFSALSSMQQHFGKSGTVTLILMTFFISTARVRRRGAAVSRHLVTCATHVEQARVCRIHVEMTKCILKVMTLSLPNIHSVVCM